MRIDQPDGEDGPARAPDVSDAPSSQQPPDAEGTVDAATASGTADAATASGEDEARNKPESSDAEAERQVRIARVTEHRVTVDAAYRPTRSTRPTRRSARSNAARSPRR
jgi:hypothetical protein